MTKSKPLVRLRLRAYDSDGCVVFDRGVAMFHTVEDAKQAANSSNIDLPFADWEFQFFIDNSIASTPIISKRGKGSELFS